jgi:hypothetical protein
VYFLLGGEISVRLVGGGPGGDRGAELGKVDPEGVSGSTGGGGAVRVGEVVKGGDGAAGFVVVAHLARWG